MLLLPFLKDYSINGVFLVGIFNIQENHEVEAKIVFSFAPECSCMLVLQLLWTLNTS